MRLERAGMALVVAGVAGVAVGCASVGEAVVAGVAGGVVSGVTETAVNRAARGQKASAPVAASAQKSEGSRYLSDPVVVLEPEGSRVPAVAVSRDGALVAVVSPQTTGGPAVALWDLVQRKPVLTLACKAAVPRALAFATARSLLAVGGDTGAIDLVETTTGNVLATLSGHAGAVNALAFSSDDATLASAGADGSVRLWDVAARRELKRLAGHEGAVLAVAFSRKGARVASGGSDGTIHLWSVESGSELEWFGRKAPIASVALFPEGDLIASGAGDALSIWDVEKRESQRTHLLSSEVRAVAVSPDGKSVAAGLANGRVDSFGLDWPSPEVFCAIDPAVVALAYSSDGKSLVIVGEDGAVYLVAVDGRLVR